MSAIRRMVPATIQPWDAALPDDDPTEDGTIDPAPERRAEPPIAEITRPLPDAAAPGPAWTMVFALVVAAALGGVLSGAVLATGLAVVLLAN